MIRSPFFDRDQTPGFYQLTKKLRINQPIIYPAPTFHFSEE
ncbi:hypothetical protein RU94_GL001961 [Enterococcus asini]|nr:hypothetical protein RU94_GL001961 [Enterococcus asini]